MASSGHVFLIQRLTGEYCATDETLAPKMIPALSMPGNEETLEC